MIQQTILPFFFGLGGRMGPGDQVMPWIHVKDVAGLMVHCVNNDKCSGVFNTVAPEVITNNTFTQSYAGSLNRPAIFPVPSFVLNTIFGEERANMVLQSQVNEGWNVKIATTIMLFSTVDDAILTFHPLIDHN